MIFFFDCSGTCKYEVDFLSLNVCFVKEKRLDIRYRVQETSPLLKENQVGKRVSSSNCHFDFDIWCILQGDAKQCFHHTDERLLGALKSPPFFPRKSRGHELWKDFVETTRLATWFYVMDSWTFFPALMISCDDLYETISLMEYQLLLVWIPSHTWPFRNSVENLGVGFVLQTVQPLTFPWNWMICFCPRFCLSWG